MRRLLRRRSVRVGVYGVVTVLLAWIVGGYFVFVRPKIDKPSRVDAILVLGPPDSSGRLDTGLTLAMQHFADTLVVSVEHGWKSILVVTSIYHISRARMIVKRCFTGRLLMVAAHGRPALSEWPYNYAYQTAGYLKAFAQGGC